METLISRNTKQSTDLSPIPNVVLPSAPVVNALVMAALGAGEDTETRRQFLTVLGIPQSTTFENISETAASLNQLIQLNGDGLGSPISRLVNILFVREGSGNPSLSGRHEAKFRRPCVFIDPC